MTATVTRLPTLVDRLTDALTAIDRVIDIDAICIDPDPEMTALLAEPVPARGMIDIIRDMIGEQE